MKSLPYLPGLICMGIGGYLAIQESDYALWFLGAGFVLALCALGDNTEEEQ